MTVTEAINLFKNYQRANLKQNTQQSYNHLLQRFEKLYGDRPFESIGPEEIYQFLKGLTEHYCKSTRRLRYSQIKAFYNLMIENGSLTVKNPYSTPMLAKSFRMPKQKPRTILDKETVDEMIYNAESLRHRLTVELQARRGLRIGEALRLKVTDVSDRKLLHQEPKSGKEEEIAFMIEQVAKRLDEYIHYSQSVIPLREPWSKSTGRNSTLRFLPMTYGDTPQLMKAEIGFLWRSSRR